MGPSRTMVQEGLFWGRPEPHPAPYSSLKFWRTSRSPLRGRFPHPQPSVSRARGAGWGRPRRGAEGSSSDPREGVGSPRLPSWEGRGLQGDPAPSHLPWRGPQEGKPGHIQGPCCPGGGGPGAPPDPSALGARLSWWGRGPGGPPDHSALEAILSWWGRRPGAPLDRSALGVMLSWRGRGPGAPPRPQCTGGHAVLAGEGAWRPTSAPSRGISLPEAPTVAAWIPVHSPRGPFLGHEVGEPTQGPLRSPHSSCSGEGVPTPLPPLTLLWAQTDPPPSPPPLLRSLPPSGDKCPAPPTSVPLFPGLCHCSAQRPGRWAGSPSALDPTQPLSFGGKFPMKEGWGGPLPSHPGECTICSMMVPMLQ